MVFEWPLITTLCQLFSHNLFDYLNHALIIKFADNCAQWYAS